MTERDWLYCVDPRAMLTDLRGRGTPTDRRLRLLACAWCWELWYRLANNACRDLVALSERAADDPALWPELDRARDAARATSTDARGVSYSGRRGAGYGAALDAAAPAVPIDRVLDLTQLLAARPAYRPFQCRLIRDLFGNPFRPAARSPDWLTSTVDALAAGIYAEKAFDRLPILADALQDAGCDNDELLDHFRGPGPHVRGCWALDLVLGRE